MHYIDGYKNLNNLIEIHKNLYDSAEIQYEYNKKIINSNAPHDISSVSYDDMPKGSRNFKDLKFVIEDMQRYENMMYIEKNIIVGLTKAKKEIEYNFKLLEGLEYKIAYKKEVEKKNLQQIADELGYSLGYIRNLSMKISKEARYEEDNCI